MNEDPFQRVKCTSWSWTGMSERADDHVHGEERNDLPPGWVLILNQADLNWSIPGTLTTTTTVTTLTLQTWCWTRNTCWMTWTSTRRGNSILWMWTRRLVWASLGNSFLAKKNVGVHLVQHPRLGFGRAPGWTWNGKSAEMSTLQHCFHNFHFKPISSRKNIKIWPIDLLWLQQPWKI